MRINKRHVCFELSITIETEKKQIENKLTVLAISKKSHALADVIIQFYGFFIFISFNVIIWNSTRQY